MGERPAIELVDLFAALRRHAWLASAIVALTIAGALAFGLSRTKIYRASATLQIDPRPPAPLGQGVEGVVELGASNYWANIEYYNTQHELIRSKPVALAVVRELALDVNSAFLANVAATQAAAAEAMDVATTADVLRERLAVAPSKDSRLVQVTFDDANPERAAKILNAVLGAYVAHNMNQAIESTSSAVQWLGEQLESLRSELSDSELALHQYKLEKQIASVGIEDRSTIMRGEISQLTEERTRVRAKIQEALARLSQLNKIEIGEAESIPQMDLLASEELQTLRRAYMESVRDKNALIGAGKGENHPDVQGALARVSTALRALTAEIQNFKSGAATELAALQQQEGGLRQLLAEVEKKALSLNLMEIEYNRLRRTKDNNEKLYGIVLERTKEAGLTQALKVNNIQVLTAASTDKSPVEPRMALILAAGVLAGLALGMGAALGRERLDRTIKSVEELEQRLGLVPLGAVPDVIRTPDTQSIPLRRAVRSFGAVPSADFGAELLAFTEPASAYGEAIRALRTNLLFMSPDEPFRRILVTSSGPAEGKTTIACALAIAMAQANHRVMLVDCDLRRPRLHRVFQSKIGLSTLSESLLDASRLDLGTTSTQIAGLDVLTAGPTPPNPAELFHSAAFRSLLRRLDDHFDVVILDSPPLIVTDAAVLSTEVDATVLVVRHGKSDRRSVMNAVRLLENVGGHLVGAILNGARPFEGGYGYGYGYGHAAAEPHAPPAAG